jgi:hypothetical protein
VKNEPTLEIDSAGNKFWYLYGERHRVDGPAIEWANGSESWWLNDNRHRVDGPAIEYADGSKGWRLNGKYYTFDDWLKINKFISNEEKLMLKLQYG